MQKIIKCNNCKWFSVCTKNVKGFAEKCESHIKPLFDLRGKENEIKPSELK